MKKTFLTTAVCVFLISVNLLCAQDQTPGVQDAKPFSAHDILFSEPELDFFCQYMLNKEFILPTMISKLDNGKMECVFDRTTKFRSISVSTKGFSFIQMYQIKQTNFDLDSNGNRMLPGRTENRNLASKISLRRSDATGKLLGSAVLLFNDHPNVGETGLADDLIVFMEGKDKFVMRTIPGRYGDYFAAGGKFKPGTSISKTEIYLENGKIVSKQIVDTFDVDPETFEKTPTGEQTIYVDYAEL